MSPPRRGSRRRCRPRRRYPRRPARSRRESASSHVPVVAAANFRTTDRPVAAARGGARTSQPRCRSSRSAALDPGQPPVIISASSSEPASAAPKLQPRLARHSRPRAPVDGCGEDQRPRTPCRNPVMPAVHIRDAAAACRADEYRRAADAPERSHGECTPPGVTARARANRSAERVTAGRRPARCSAARAVPRN